MPRRSIHSVPSREARLDRRQLDRTARRAAARLYRLTPEGKKVLAAQRSLWRAFVKAIDRAVGVEHA